jgi:hypothetical protein
MKRGGQQSINLLMPQHYLLARILVYQHKELTYCGTTFHRICKCRTQDPDLTKKGLLKEYKMLLLQLLLLYLHKEVVKLLLSFGNKHICLLNEILQVGIHLLHQLQTMLKCLQFWHRINCWDPRRQWGKHNF